MSRLLWTQKRNIGPARRSSHAMAYDEVRGRTVLFGGSSGGAALLGDTWEWDGDNWTQMNDVGPADRSGHAMAFAGAGVLLFGGVAPTSRADTWSWDGEDWTQLTDGGPSPRADHTLAFDSSRQRVVLFGGAGASETGAVLLNDTWEWDGQEWTQQADTGPTNRRLHTMAFDSARNRVVLFGGANAADAALGDTWEWNGAVWTQVASFGPPPCAGGALAFKGSGVALFGGIDSVAPIPGAQLFGTTWEWDGRHWALRQDIGPSARWALAMAFDRNRNHLVLFGGSTSPVSTENLQSDTWEHSEALAQGGPRLQALDVLLQGQDLQASVTLTSPAPAGGLSVSVTGFPGFFRPGDVTVVAGSNTGAGTFPCEPGFVGTGISATVTATLAGNTASATVRV